MDWQEIASLAIVTATLALMIRSGLRSARRDRDVKCGGCSSCPSARQDSLNLPEKWRTLSHELKEIA